MGAPYLWPSVPGRFRAALNSSLQCVVLSSMRNGRGDAGLPMTTWQNLIMVIDDGRVPAHAYAAQDVHMLRLGADYPGNVGSLVVIPPHAVPPTDEARRAINAVMEKHAASLKSVVCVVEGRGFQSAVVRATLTTMTLTLRKMRGWKVASNVDEALGHLVTRTRTRPDGTVPALDLAEARRALEALRAQSPSIPRLKTG
jgi:hypothetical protein